MTKNKSSKNKKGTNTPVDTSCLGPGSSSSLPMSPVSFLFICDESINVNSLYAFCNNAINYVTEWSFVCLTCTPFMWIRNVETNKVLEHNLPISMAPSLKTVFSMLAWGTILHFRRSWKFYCIKHCITLHLCWLFICAYTVIYTIERVNSAFMITGSAQVLG